MKSIMGRLLTARFFYRPVFVVGDGRSGTSALLQALGQHPLIFAVPGEAPLITSVGGMASLFECAKDSTREYYSESLKTTKPYLYQVLRRLCFETASGENYGLTLCTKTLIDNPRLFMSKRYWCAKTFPPEIVANGLLKLYPDSKLIYIIRNGIEVVQSKTRFHGFRENQFSEHCEVWRDNIMKYRYVKGLESGLEIRHEKLVAHPEDVLRMICIFLNVKFHSSPSDFIKTNLVHPLGERGQVGVDVTSILRRRPPAHGTWSADQRSLFKEICAQAMLETGYAIPF